VHVQLIHAQAFYADEDLKGRSMCAQLLSDRSLKGHLPALKKVPGPLPREQLTHDSARVTCPDCIDALAALLDIKARLRARRGHAAG